MNLSTDSIQHPDFFMKAKDGLFSDDLFGGNGILDNLLSSYTLLGADYLFSKIFKSESKHDPSLFKRKPNFQESVDQSSEHPHVASIIEKDGAENELQTPMTNETHYYKMWVDSGKVSWITDEGEESNCSVTAWEERGQPVTAEQLYLYDSIFWEDMDHLMFPWSERRECSVVYHHTLQKLVHLPISDDGTVSDNAEVPTATRGVMFGCAVFPGNFIGKTLKRWKDDPSTLEEIIIGWSEPIENRKGTMEALNSRWFKNKMTHIWSPSSHSESLFEHAEISRLKNEIAQHTNEETEDCVDMYLLYSDNGTHIAVLSITDVSVSIHCGLKEGEWTVPIFRKAFEFVTELEHDYYEIVEERVPRAPLQT